MRVNYINQQTMSRIKTTVKETAIQQGYFAWVRLHPSPKLQWVHSIPNGARRSITTARRAIAEGLTSGVADVFVPYANDLYHGLYLEFKTPKGKQTLQQQAFEKYCNDNGYRYVVVRSVDDAIKITCEHLGI